MEARPFVLTHPHSNPVQLSPPLPDAGASLANSDDQPPGDPTYHRTKFRTLPVNGGEKWLMVHKHSSVDAFVDCLRGFRRDSQDDEDNDVFVLSAMPPPSSKEEEDEQASPHSCLYDLAFETASAHVAEGATTECSGRRRDAVWCLVFGNEVRGVSDAMVQASTGTFSVPQVRRHLFVVVYVTV